MEVSRPEKPQEGGHSLTIGKPHPSRSSSSLKQVQSRSSLSLKQVQAPHKSVSALRCCLQGGSSSAELVTASEGTATDPAAEDRQPRAPPVTGSAGTGHGLISECSRSCTSPLKDVLAHVGCTCCGSDCSLRSGGPQGMRDQPASLCTFGTGLTTSSRNSVGSRRRGSSGRAMAGRLGAMAGCVRASLGNAATQPQPHWAMQSCSFGSHATDDCHRVASPESSLAYTRPLLCSINGMTEYRACALANALPATAQPALGPPTGAVPSVVPQECACLPQYCSSKLCDRLSDYEDIWGSSSSSDSDCDDALDRADAAPTLTTAGSLLAPRLTRQSNCSTQHAGPAFQVFQHQQCNGAAAESAGSKADDSAEAAHVGQPPRRTRVGSVPAVIVTKLSERMPARRRLSLGIVRQWSRQSFKNQPSGDGGPAVGAKKPSFISRQPSWSGQLRCDVIRCGKDSAVMSCAVPCHTSAVHRRDAEMTACAGLSAAAPGMANPENRHVERCRSPASSQVPADAAAEHLQKRKCDRLGVEHGSVQPAAVRDEENCKSKASLHQQEARGSGPAASSGGSITRAHSFRERQARSRSGKRADPKTLPPGARGSRAVCATDREKRWQQLAGGPERVFKEDRLVASLRDAVESESCTSIGLCPKFPTHLSLALDHTAQPAADDDGSSICSSSQSLTLLDVVQMQSPEYNLEPIRALTSRNLLRLSTYDNLPPLAMGQRLSAASYGSTVFSKPWDAQAAEELLRSAAEAHGGPILQSCSSEESFGLQMRDVEATATEEESLCRVFADGSNVYYCPPMERSSTCVNDDPLQALEEFRNHAGDSDKDDACSSRQACGWKAQAEAATAVEQDETQGVVRHRQSEEADSGTELDSSMDNIYQRKASTNVPRSGSYERQLPRLGLCRNSQTSLQDFCQKVKQMRSPRLSSIRSPSLSQQSADADAAVVAAASQPGTIIRRFVWGLAQDTSTLFGDAVRQFIRCTQESSESNPRVLLSNIRQFMTGIKHYLMNRGDPALDRLLQDEKLKLVSGEFLNVDAILEGALLKRVALPLKPVIYRVFVSFFNKNGSLKAVSDGMRAARSKSVQELGIKVSLLTSGCRTMESIKSHLVKMQNTYSPIRKLESLLAACSEVYDVVGCADQPAANDSCDQQTDSQAQVVQAEDFLMMLVYVLVQCGAVSAEIEAEYMRGLLPPSLSCAESAYYITALSSVVAIIKGMGSSSQPMGSPMPMVRHGSLASSHSFVKVFIPNESTSSIVSVVVPTCSSITVKEICSMVAHRLLITNPQDYTLCVVADGKESRIASTSTLAETAGRWPGHAVAFKRTSAQIIWPAVLE